MYTVAYRITGNYDDACDAMQEGFVQIFRDLKNFGGKSTLGAWIKTIIVRAALKRIDNKNRTEELTEINCNEQIYWDDNLTGEELEKAIIKLSPGFRSVFTLIEIEGYSHKEVAEILEISVGTSKSQLYHAKKALQKELAHFVNC